MKPYERYAEKRLFGRSVPAAVRHLFIMKGRGWNGAKCLMMYHNKDFHSSAQGDYKTVHRKNVLGWTAPDKKAIAQNATRRMKWFLVEMIEFTHST